MKSYSVNKSHLLPTIFQNLIWGIHKDVVLLQGYAHLPITLFVRLLGFFSFYVFRHLTHGHFLVLFSSLYKHTKSIRHSSLLPILQLSALPEPSHQTLLPLQDPSRDSSSWHTRWSISRAVYWYLQFTSKCIKMKGSHGGTRDKANS